MRGTALALVLAGCAAPPAPDSAADAVRPSGAIALLPLERDDGAALEGELLCSFARDDGRTLLLAAADVRPDARASAVVRNAQGPLTLTAREAGGFGALERAAVVLAGAGMAVEIARGARQATGTEETRFAAVLTATAPDGASRSQRGRWNCGP